MRTILSKRQFAERCGISVRHLERLNSFGKGPPLIQLGPRASCFWVYAYPALLRYAAHSAGGYWARILPQASEDRLVASRFRLSQ